MKRTLESVIRLFACLAVTSTFAQTNSKPELLPWHESFSIEKIGISDDAEYLVTIGDDHKAVITDLRKRTPLHIIPGVESDYLEMTPGGFYTLHISADSFHLQKRILPSGDIKSLVSFPAYINNPAMRLSTFGSPVVSITGDGSFAVCFEESNTFSRKQLVHFDANGDIKKMIGGITSDRIHAIRLIGGQFWVLASDALWKENNGQFEKVLSPENGDHFANMQARGDSLVVLSSFVQWFDTRAKKVLEKTSVRSFYASGENDLTNALILQARHPFILDEDGAVWLANTRRLELQTGKARRPYYVARIINGNITYPLAGPDFETGGKFREVNPVFAYNPGAGLFAFVHTRAEEKLEIASKENGYLFSMERRHIPVEDIFMLADTGKLIVRLNTYYSDGVLLDLSNGRMETVSLRDDYHINTERFTGSAEFRPSNMKLEIYSPGRRTFRRAGTWQNGRQLRINIPRKDSAIFLLKNNITARLNETGSLQWFNKDNKVVAFTDLKDDESRPVMDGWFFDRYSYDSASSLLTLYWKSRSTFSSELAHVIHLQNKKQVFQKLSRGFLMLPGGKQYVTGEGIFSLEENKMIAAFPAEFAYANRFMVSPNGKFIVFLLENYDREDDIYAWDLQNKKMVPLGSQQGIKKMIPDPYSNLLFTVGRDQKVKVWNMNRTGLITQIVFNAYRGDYRDLGDMQPSYLFLMPGGYYMGENRYYNMLAWREGEREFPVHQMDTRFHRPDKVLQALGYADEKMIQTLGSMAEKRALRSRLADVKADVSVEEKGNIPFIVKNGVLRFSVSTPVSSEEKLQVYINGTALWTGGKPITDLGKMKRIVEVPLVDQHNHIRICLVDNGKETPGDYFYVNAKAIEKKDLYFVGVGISDYADPRHNLRYAVKDMTDIYRYFMTTTSFTNTYSFTASNEKVSRNTMDSIKTFLAKAKPQDQVIFYYAGHGMLDTATGNYFLSTYQWQPEKPARTGFFIDDLNNAIASSPARKKIMMIDACNSGLPDDIGGYSANEDTSTAVVARGFKVNAKAQDANAVRFAFNHFNQGNGVDIMAAAAGNEYAYETDSLQNGLFTYSLLSALKSGDADRDHNNGIQVSEMQFYVAGMVKHLSRGRQQPSFRQANLYQDVALVASDDSYFAALLQAAQTDHLAVMRICIENEKIPVNKQDEHGFTALHYACRNGSAKAFKYLVGKGADIHLKTNFYFSPLYLAALNKHEYIVYQLLGKGVNPKNDMAQWQQDSVLKKTTPFIRLMVTDYQKMKEQEAMQYQLIRFLATGNIASADSLFIKEKPDVNYWHYGEGLNAAFAAIFNKQQKGLEWLIAHGLDVNLSNAAIDHFTPLMAAAYTNNSEIARLLIKHGASKTARDKNGNTALDIARQNNSKSVVSLLEQ